MTNRTSITVECYPSDSGAGRFGGERSRGWIGYHGERTTGSPARAEGFRSPFGICCGLALGVIVGAIALWLALRGAAIGGLRSALGRADVFWILLALGSVLLTLAVAVVRWRILFHPESAGLSWGNLTAAFLVGQMLNIMLPLRLGEVARAYWLSRSEDIPMGRALGTIGVEKLADLASIGLAAVALLVLAAVPPWVQSPGRVLVITGAIAVAGMLVLAASRRWLLQGATRVAQRWPRPIGGRVIGIVETILQGSRAVHSWKASAAVGLLTVARAAAGRQHQLSALRRLPSATAPGGRAPAADLAAGREHPRLGPGQPRRLSLRHGADPGRLLGGP